MNKGVFSICIYEQGETFGEMIPNLKYVQIYATKLYCVHFTDKKGRHKGDR